MTSTLFDLLFDCTVKLTMSNGTCGTGFLVAQGYVLTCEHVVRAAGNLPIRIRWRQQENFAQGHIEVVHAEIDVALVRFEPPIATLPCVYFDLDDVAVGDPLYLFGYPDDPDYPNGRPVTPECEGFTGDNPPLYHAGARADAARDEWGCSAQSQNGKDLWHS